MVKTSQRALPEDVSAAVYATQGYEQSAVNLGHLAGDRLRLPRRRRPRPAGTVTGSVEAGYVAALAMPV